MTTAADAVDDCRKSSRANRSDTASRLPEQRAASARINTTRKRRSPGRSSAQVHAELMQAQVDTDWLADDLCTVCSQPVGVRKLYCSPECRESDTEAGAGVSESLKAHRISQAGNTCSLLPEGVQSPSQGSATRPFVRSTKCAPRRSSSHASERESRRASSASFINRARSESDAGPCTPSPSTPCRTGDEKFRPNLNPLFGQPIRKGSLSHISLARDPRDPLPYPSSPMPDETPSRTSIWSPGSILHYSRRPSQAPLPPPVLFDRRPSPTPIYENQPRAPKRHSYAVSMLGKKHQHLNSSEEEAQTEGPPSCTPMARSCSASFHSPMVRSTKPPSTHPNVQSDCCRTNYPLALPEDEAPQVETHIPSRLGAAFPRGASLARCQWHNPFPLSGQPSQLKLHNKTRRKSAHPLMPIQDPSPSAPSGLSPAMSGGVSPLGHCGV